VNKLIIGGIDSSMEFSLDLSIAQLERTPGLLSSWLSSMPTEWTQCDEGSGTWTVEEILGHLIHGERVDWIPRAQIILSDASNRAFERFDRFAMQRADSQKSLDKSVDEFVTLREKNILSLLSMSITESSLERCGIHPEFGSVTMAQLLSAWVAHDLTHIAQIARVMAHQYESAVGPWSGYMRIYRK
jgi:uncharacterized damage-inducible protein DinB